MLTNIPQYVKSQTKEEIVLSTNTRFMLMPSAPAAARSWTKARAVLVDEACHSDLQIDEAWLSAVLPIVKASGGDMWMISTPNGTSNMMHKIMTSDSDKWIRHTLTIDDCAPGLYTDEEKAEILRTSDEDIEQEYLCKANNKPYFISRLIDRQRLY